MIEPVRIEERTYIDKELQDYWVMRAVRNGEGRKTIIDEHIMEWEPDKQTIANYLYSNPRATFISVEHNYRFTDHEF